MVFMGKEANGKLGKRSWKFLPTWLPFIATLLVPVHDGVDCFDMPCFPQLDRKLQKHEMKQIFPS